MEPGQLFNCFGKFQAVEFHHERTDGIAVRTTAETMIKLFVLADRERRGFFVVEWATGLIVFAGFFKFYATVHQLNNVGAGFSRSSIKSRGIRPAILRVSTQIG